MREILSKCNKNWSKQSGSPRTITQLKYEQQTRSYLPNRKQQIIANFCTKINKNKFTIDRISIHEKILVSQYSIDIGTNKNPFEKMKIVTYSIILVIFQICVINCAENSVNVNIKNVVNTINDKFISISTDFLELYENYLLNLHNGWVLEFY